MWIELPIAFHKEDSQNNPLYEELGLEVEEELETKIIMVNTDNIFSYYPYYRDSSKTVLEAVGSESNLLAEITYKELKNIIKNS